MLTERVRPELMTGYDVAASGRYPYTVRFGMLTALDRDVIAQSLALVRVEERADKPFACVSDGQRQRVMICLLYTSPSTYYSVRDIIYSKSLKKAIYAAASRLLFIVFLSFVFEIIGVSKRTIPVSYTHLVGRY